MAMSATGDPIHFVFGTRVGFSGTADRAALFTVRTNPKMDATAMLKKFQVAISPQPVVWSTSCFVLRCGFRGRRILWRYFRSEQIQDGGHRHLEKISSGHISATSRPIHFMLGYSMEFSGTADLMALFSIRTNSRWWPPPSWIISNGHISATAHDLLI